MNIELLRKVQAAIIAEPRQFQMRSWFTDRDAYDNTRPPNCGTACCIGGWAVSIAQGKNPKESNGGPYRKVLDLDYDQANRLFYIDNWPSHFRGGVFGVNFDSLPPLKRATLASARIDHFIFTEGQE